MAAIKLLVDEVQHQDEVVVHRTTREPTKLVYINIGADVRPYPLDQETFKSLAEYLG